VSTPQYAHQYPLVLRRGSYVSTLAVTTRRHAALAAIIYLMDTNKFICLSYLYSIYSGYSRHIIQNCNNQIEFLYNQRPHNKFQDIIQQMLQKHITNIINQNHPITLVKLNLNSEAMIYEHHGSSDSDKQDVYCSMAMKMSLQVTRRSSL
jgi:hypothetical protein